MGGQTQTRSPNLIANGAREQPGQGWRSSIRGPVVRPLEAGRVAQIAHGRDAGQEEVFTTACGDESWEAGVAPRAGRSLPGEVPAAWSRDRVGVVAEPVELPPVQPFALHELELALDAGVEEQSDKSTLDAV